MKYITVLLLEAKEAQLFLCSISADGVIDVISQTKWNPSQYLVDTNGARLIEEISRRIRDMWKQQKHKADGLVVSLPGTLRDEVTIVSSSRLGIREPVEISNILGKRLGIPCCIYHDTECLITGEITRGEYFGDNVPSSLVYVFIDEGIGSKIVIEGKHYIGAGTAGLLGRLIVQPEGEYFPALRSSGCLEVYSSRPWVSRRLVEVYHSENGKKGSALSDEVEYSKFRQALKIASASDDWSQIMYDRIASGITEKDPIALHVIDNAARYLGYSINTVITLINPEFIILGGAMITELPDFAQMVINYARQYSWPIAWNNTSIHISEHGREMQLYGSVELALSFLEKRL